MRRLLETSTQLTEIHPTPRAKHIALGTIGVLLALEIFFALTVPVAHLPVRALCLILLVGLAISICAHTIPVPYAFCLLTLTGAFLSDRVSDAFFLLSIFGVPLVVLIASSRQTLALALSLFFALTSNFTFNSPIYWSITTTSLFIILFGFPFILRLAWEQKVATDRKYKELQEQVAETNKALARELHDTVARHISIIGLSTNQALEANTLDAKNTALTTIQEKTHKALADMRLLIQATRSDHSVTALPQISSVTINLEESLEQAIAGLTRKGFTVDADIALANTDIPEGVRPTLHKVIHEIRFNAEKYATPRSTITVTVRPNLTGITISTSNPVPPRTKKKSHSPSTGYGLVGIQERIRRLGGTISYGIENQTWRLTINLPLITA